MNDIQKCYKRGLFGALGALASVAALALPRSVAAQSVDHHLQLSLSANLLAYDSLTLSSASAGAVSMRETTWGPGAAGLGLGLGYGVSDNWLIGVQLLGSSTTSSVDTPGTTDSKLTSYSILPRVEYVFTGEPTLRPYVGLTLGLRGSSISGTGSDVSASDLVFGGVAGLRAFATPTFSIDPSMTLMRLTGAQKGGAVDLDRSGFSLLLGVSLSGWIDTFGVAPAHVSPPPALVPTAALPTTSAEMRPAVNALGEPEATLETDDDGAMRAEIVVAGRGRVRLVGRPSRDGSDVLVELIGISTASALGQCTDFGVLVDGNERAARGRPRPVPGVSNAFQLLVAPSLIGSVGAAERSAVLVVCGTDWEITSGARSVIQAFFERFRNSAQRYGHWASGEPSVPMEPPKAAGRR